MSAPTINLVELAQDAARLVQQSSELVAKIALLACDSSPEKSEWITSKEALATYNMGAAALAARHIRRSKQGRTVVWDREQIEQSISSGAAPAKPRLRKAAPLENEDPLDQMIAHGELRRTR